MDRLRVAYHRFRGDGSRSTLQCVLSVHYGPGEHDFGHPSICFFDDFAASLPVLLANKAMAVFLRRLRDRLRIIERREIRGTGPNRLPVFSMLVSRGGKAIWPSNRASIWKAGSAARSSGRLCGPEIQIAVGIGGIDRVDVFRKDPPVRQVRADATPALIPEIAPTRIQRSPN